MAKKETSQQLAFEAAYLKKHPKKMQPGDAALVRKYGGKMPHGKMPPHAAPSTTKPASGFNPYAAGAKHYGAGRAAPTHGKVDPIGYKQRDAKAAARKRAIAAKLAQMRGN